MISFFSRQTLEFLFDTSIYVVCIPVIVLALRRGKFKPEQVVIAFLVVLNLLNDCLTLFLKTKGSSNLWVYHGFVPLVFLLILEVYKGRMKSIIPGNLISYLQCAFVFFAVANTILWQPLTVFNSNAIFVASIIYVIFSIAFFYYSIQGKEQSDFFRQPMFWFNSGVLLYYSSTLVLFMFVDNIIEVESNILIAAWILNVIFNMCLNISYSIALWIKARH